MPRSLRWFDDNDPQRQRVYAAEREVPFPREPEFGSLAEIRHFVTDVTKTRTWRALSANTRQERRLVDVRRGRTTHAHARVEVFGVSRITLPPHEWRRWGVFHELAHCAR